MKTIIYQIRIKEQLHELWAETFFPLILCNEADESTTLRGALHDQTELQSILTKICALNLTLLAVNRIDSTEETK